jgi:C-5 cytosine-specific DNA methylase
VSALAIDLFCGLGGWTEGLLAEDYYVVGFDIEQHVYREERYPGQLVIQDVLTLHGSQFKDAALIVASPPCQEYSYMAMPWKLAKAKAAAIRADTTGAALKKLNQLFNACLRIQKEASMAAGRHIPMVVENVRGAIPWVGRSRWNFGSFHLWGDVPALMPMTTGGIKVPSFRFDGSGKSFQSALRRTAPGNGTRFTSRDCGIEKLHSVDQSTGTKIGGDWFSDPNSTCRRHGSKSKARKAASALIAKIPLPLSQHIAATYKPKEERV